MAEVSSGAVTFLFTDVGGSTRLLKELRDEYPDALQQHQRLLREAFTARGGHEVDTQGDAFFVTFGRARDAIAAALDGQRFLGQYEWPKGAQLSVRMGIHSGEATFTDNRWFGLAVHRAARICAAAYGGQVLVSQTTKDLVEDEEVDLEGIEFRDLGEHQLKDLDRPVRIYQLVAAGVSHNFPPLQTREAVDGGPRSEPAKGPAFKILGPLEVWLDARQVEIRRPKELLVLAALLLHASDVVSVGRLTDEVWPYGAPAKPTDAIQELIYQLRRKLEPRGSRGDLIERTGDGYRLRLDQDSVDLHRFERLVRLAQDAFREGDLPNASSTLMEALSLWRGRPLANVPFESLTATAAEALRLEELRLTALIQRMEIDLELGADDELIGELEVLIAEHPLDERLRRLLMLSLYRARRQAEALDAYKQARSILDEQLGIEPSRPLKELEQAILRQDPALDPMPSVAPGANPAVAEASTHRTIVVAALEEGALDPLLDFGAPLARSQLGRELLLALIVDPAKGNVSEATAALHKSRATLLGGGVECRCAAFTSSAPAEDLVRLAGQHDVDLLLMTLPPEALEEDLVPEATAGVLHGTQCDVGLLVRRESAGNGEVVVPFGALRNDWAALEIGAWIASARETKLTLLGIRAPDETGSRDASRLLADASLLVQSFLGLSPDVRLVAPGPTGVMEASRDSSLLVLGLSETWRQSGLGRTRSMLAREAAPPVLFVRKGTRPGGLAPRDTTVFAWSLTSMGSQQQR